MINMALFSAGMKYTPGIFGTGLTLTQQVYHTLVSGLLNKLLASSAFNMFY